MSWVAVNGIQLGIFDKGNEMVSTVEVVSTPSDPATQGNMGVEDERQVARGSMTHSVLPAQGKKRVKPGFGEVLDGMWLKAMTDCGVPMEELWIPTEKTDS